jgi:hypothetical protein
MLTANDIRKVAQHQFQNGIATHFSDVAFASLSGTVGTEIGAVSSHFLGRVCGYAGDPTAA